MVGLNLIQVLLIAVGVTNFALGLLVLFGFNKKKDSSSIWFATLTFSVVLWIISMILYRKVDNTNNIYIYTKILYSSALLIPTVFLIFVNRFISKNNSYKSEFLTILFFIILVILTLFTSNIINLVTINKPLENQILFGNLFFIYVMFLIITFNLAFYNLILKYNQNKGVKKTQILFIILGTTLSTYPAFFTNLLLPWVGIFNLNWFGQISTIFLIIFTTYAIFKHHLFNIKMILSEILLGVMSIFLFIYIFLSRNTYEFIVSTVFFIIFIILGYNLLRELLNGIKREKELSISNRKLEETIESKDMFLRMTSHQLRTPLTSLNGFLSLILEQWQGKYKMNEYTRDDIVKVYINVQRLVEAVNDVLSFNSIKANRFGIAIRPEINIKDELTYLIQDNKYILDSFNTTTNIKTIGENFIANVDNVRMKSVFQNLLTNAIYYGQNKIWITLIDEGDRLKIRFRDNGEGIDESIKEKIFHPGFRQLDNSTRNPNGSGLGLFISKTIVDMHHGSLKLKNTGIGNGALFEIKIPKQPPIDKYTS